MRFSKLLVGVAVASGLSASCGSSRSTVGPYPNNYDAVTMLASASSQVLLLKVTGVTGVGLDTKISAEEEQVLQTDYNHLGSEYASYPYNLGVLFGPHAGVTVGNQYVVFVSYDRSGDCLAAAFSFTVADQPVHLVLTTADFGPDAPRGFRLKDRFLAMPTSIRYEQLVRRLYPTGGELDASNTGESYCPGP